MIDSFAVLLSSITAPMTLMFVYIFCGTIILEALLRRSTNAECSDFAAALLQPTLSSRTLAAAFVLAVFLVIWPLMFPLAAAYSRRHPD